jgi:CubicO group peptidase (beta-lactamase class C family)
MNKRSEYMDAMKWIRAGVITFVIVAFAGCSSMPKKPETLALKDYSYTKEYITWLVEQQMRKHDVTGLSVALVDDQQVVWAEGFGFADRKNNIAAGPNTIYRVGSISKLFTTLAAMQLVEQGKLDIDKPIRNYLPEISIKSRFPETRPITPRTLMTHHSGLPSDLQKGMWSSKPENFRSVVEKMKGEYVANPPDTVFAYSNLGMTILGVTVAEVSGKEFGAYMSQNVLGPLNMANSAFAADCDRSSAAAKAYRKDDAADEPGLRDVPAGGLNSTVVDLSRFMQMVFAGGRSGGKELLKPETLAETLRPQSDSVPLDLDHRVGLGWQLGGLGGIDIRNAGIVAHHAGASINYHSMLITLPGHKLGVVVLSNSAASGPAVNKIAEEMLKLALEAKTGIRQPKQPEIPAKANTPSREMLQGYGGRYATFVGLVPVNVREDHLRTEVMGMPIRLIPRTDNTLGLEYRLFGLIPISLGDLDRVGISWAEISGRNILKVGLNGREMLLGERIQPMPIPSAWMKRLGKYEIINPGDDHVLVEGIRLRNDAGLLVIDYSIPLVMKGTLQFALKPISETEAVIYGLGRGMGETIGVVTVRNDEMLTYSGYLLKKQAEK